MTPWADPGPAAAADTLVLATRNDGKLRELARILGHEVRLAGLDAFPGAPDVPETGATFEENALLKARATAAYTGLPAVADDSGLCVDALGGMPGVLSARWAGAHGDDQANLNLVLAQLADVPEARLGAHFVCAAALVVPCPGQGTQTPQTSQTPQISLTSLTRQIPQTRQTPQTSPAPQTPREWVVTGRVDGRLTRVPRGSGGFGYDPIFVPDGFDVTTAEMTPEAKDAISHRGRAFRALVPFIAGILGEGTIIYS
jgi:XTP/dITP diphosphohydrolase